MEFESTQALEVWKRLSRSGTIWCVSELRLAEIYRKMRRGRWRKRRAGVLSLSLPIIPVIQLDFAPQFCAWLFAAAISD